MYPNLIKVVLDKFTAFLLLLMLSPVFFSIIVLLYFQCNQVFFKQFRIGKNKKAFKIYKFKTMSEAVDVQGNLLPDTFRITVFGKFLRATSLDELPQLINVLKGDMSIVGPRPLLPNYAHLYSDFQNIRHQVLPGITGFTQVKGRNALTWQERFELDIFYVKNISFVFDCKILFLTLFAVIQLKKSQPSEDIPIEPFEGQW